MTRTVFPQYDRSIPLLTLASPQRVLEKVQELAQKLRNQLHMIQEREQKRPPRAIRS